MCACVCFTRVLEIEINYYFSGFQYPPFKESDSMFDVEQAPEWKDDTNCFRCRVEFSTFNRKVAILINVLHFIFIVFFFF